MAEARSQKHDDQHQPTASPVDADAARPDKADSPADAPSPDADPPRLPVPVPRDPFAPARVERRPSAPTSPNEHANDDDLLADDAAIADPDAAAPVFFEPDPADEPDACDANPTPPRRSLQRKLILWTMAMALIPALLCTLWMSRIGKQIMTESHGRDADMLCHSLTHALSDKLALGWSDEAQRVLDSLFLERRLAFVVVTDSDGRVLHRHSIDFDAWAAFTRATGPVGTAGSVDTDRPLFFGDYDEIVVRRLPIWNPPTRTDQPRRLEGYVMLGLRDWETSAAIERLAWAQTGAAALVCLFGVPLAWFAVRKATKPLLDLLVATRRLEAGETPDAVAVHSRDEIGQLAEAFNHMSRNLSASQRELRIANEQLERKVESRTAELRTVNDRLRNEIRERNEFLRAVSHDLGAPLRNIQGMTSLLISKHRAHLADDAMTKLERISANVKMQIELLNDLMELSRIRTRPGRREPVDLHDLVLTIRDSLSYDLDTANIAFSIENPLPTVFAERNRMRQVFQNLLDNAVKYMLESDERRITVDVREDGDNWRFSVTDTGCGIAKEDQANVFDVFRRATHSGSHHVAGKGVGLASVKAIVECYGGRIWLESQLGAGTTFHFTMNADAVQVPQLT